MTERDSTEDITDLEQARRIIADQRKTIERLQREAEPLDGEFTLVLDDTHTVLLIMLFQARRLVDNQHESWEMEQILAGILSSYLDVQYVEMRAESEQYQPLLITSA